MAEYFYERKLLTVNGMHTTLAFMTLCEDFKAKKQLLEDAMGFPCAPMPLSSVPGFRSGLCVLCLCARFNSRMSDF